MLFDKYNLCLHCIAHKQSILVPAVQPKRLIKSFRAGQPIVDFDAGDNFRLNFTKNETMTLQDDK